MASASRTPFCGGVSQFVILLLLLLLVLLIHESRSCPESIHFTCPDNIYNGLLPTSHFTTTSLRPNQYCRGPCELTCDDNSRTMIDCTDKKEPSYKVLDINPTVLTIAVDYPPNRRPPLVDPEDFCRAYNILSKNFPSFQLVSLNAWGKDDTFLGYPYQYGDLNWDKGKIICNDSHTIVYGPNDHGHIPAGYHPLNCMQVQKYSPPNKNHGRLAPALEIALPSVGILAGLIIGLYFYLRRKKSPANLNVEAFLRSYGTLAPQRFSYSDIKKMTNSFIEKVGQGGFGTVYKGRLVDGRLVAVKLLKQSKGDNREDFINEVASMGRTNHVNIVTLLGFCFERNKRALVYEFMANGSLEKFTKATGDQNVYAQYLTWRAMFEISLGIARGLEYLHRGCQTRILHFDIKPHNILLDENFCPKISDFGLAKLYPQDKQSKVSMSMARGTIGYIAPEVFCRSFGDVSHKSDVYSYGMMVLEVIGNRRRENNGEEVTNSDSYFPCWIYKQLDREEEIGELGRDEKELKRKLILVSLWCIQTVPSSRPSMSRVVQMLEARLESIEIPPMPTLSSPPRSKLYPSGSESFTDLRSWAVSTINSGGRICSARRR